MDSPTWKTTNSSIVLAWDENDYSGSDGDRAAQSGRTALSSADQPSEDVRIRDTSNPLPVQCRGDSMK